MVTLDVIFPEDGIAIRKILLLKKEEQKYKTTISILVKNYSIGEKISQ